MTTMTALTGFLVWSAALSYFSLRAMIHALGREREASPEAAARHETALRRNALAALGVFVAGILTLLAFG